MKRKYKLVFIHNHLNYGGASRVMLEYLDGLKERYSISLITIRPLEQEMKILVPVDIEHNSLIKYDYFSVKKNKPLNLLNKILKHINRTSKDYFIKKRLKKISKRCDLVVANLDGYIAYLTSLIEKPKVVWIHSALTLENMPIELMNSAYGRYDAAIAVSDGVKSNAVNKYNSLAKLEMNNRFFTISNPLPIEKISKLSWQEPATRLPDKPYFLGMGRLVDIKNFSLLISAYCRVNKLYPEFRLMILGDGPLKIKLESEAIELGIHENVILTGSILNPYPYLRNCFSLVLSSDSEGLPTVLLESLSLGKAIIATNCPYGPAEILDNGEYGILIPVNNVDSMADNMIKLIENPELKRQFELKARERAKYYAKEQSFSKVEEVIDNLLLGNE